MNKQPVSVRSLFGFPIVRGIGRDYTIPQVDLSAEPDGIQPLITVTAVVHTSAIRIPFSPKQGKSSPSSPPGMGAARCLAA